MSGRLGVLCAGQGAPSTDTGTNAAASAQLATQPALVEDALAQWRSLGPLVPAPTVVAGYSLGELVAVAVAGAASHGTMVALAEARAQAMVAATVEPSGIVAVHGRRIVDRFDDVAPAGCAAAIVNGPDELVVGGTSAALAELAVQLGAAARITPLPIGVASHTPSLASAATAFREALADADIGDATVPVVRSRDGAVVRSRDDLVDMLARNVCTTVRWDLTMQVVAEQQLDGLVEIGAGTALSRLWSEHQGDPWAHAVMEYSAVGAAGAWVAAHLG